MRRSLMLHVQIIRVEATNLRARAAIAAAVVRPAERARLFREAARDARALRREDAPYAHPQAMLLEASIAAMRGEAPRAIALLRDAIDAFGRVDMHLHARVAQLRLGRMIGGEEGEALAYASRTWMRAQGIASPEGFARVVAPGFVLA